jgi:hypothetical protein
MTKLLRVSWVVITTAVAIWIYLRVSEGEAHTPTTVPLLLPFVLRRGWVRPKSNV